MPNLKTFAEIQGIEITALDADICGTAGTLAWDHRDPFDRIIAATALAYNVPVVSSDRVFDGIVSRIW